MVLVHLNIDPDLLQRSKTTAEEEGTPWNDYVLGALSARVLADNVERSGDGIHGRSSGGEPGE